MMPSLPLIAHFEIDPDAAASNDGYCDAACPYNGRVKKYLNATHWEGQKDTPAVPPKRKIGFDSLDFACRQDSRSTTKQTRAFRRAPLALRNRYWAASSFVSATGR
jgi:hypothetical protein